MKKLVIMLFVLCLGTLSAVAQISRYYDQEQRERAAKLNAGWWADIMKLSDEQTQKVYDLIMKRFVAEASVKTTDELIEVHKEYRKGLQKVLTPRQKRRERNFYKSLDDKMGYYDEIINLTPEELQRRAKSTTRNIAEQLRLSQEQKQKFFDLEMERLTKIKSSTGTLARYNAEYVAGLEKILTPEQWARIEKPAAPARKTPEELAREKEENEKKADKTRKDLQKKLDKAAQKQQKQLDKAAKKQ